MRTITEPFTLSNDGLVDIRKGKDAQEAEATTTSACSSSDSSSSLSDRVPSRSIFLTPDQRYEIWLVKAAERPELLGRYTDDDSASRSEHETSDGSSDGEDSSNLPLPFTDGCDIDGWRRHGLARPTKTKDVSLSGKMTTRQRSSPSFSPYWQAVFNVGQGCTLFRRDGQLPLLPTSMNDDYIRSPWNALKERLSVVRPHRHHSPNGIERIHYSDIVHRHSITPFSYSVRPHFEQHNYPVVLLGCTDNWKATHSCQFDSLVERFGHLHWRFSDTHAETITLQTYNKYLREGALVDDAPLAVYDSQFAEMLDDGDDISDNTDGNYEQKSTRLDERACLLEDYEVPICFQHDLFDLLEQRDRVARPPYRWILIGPERSGTGLHIDPVGTHAWVTLVQGLKRWILFPPNDPRYTAEAIYMQEPQIPSAIWFHDYYDQVMNRSQNPKASTGTANEMVESHGVVELLQHPGETVYVPAGWPHLVLNLELSVAITHNYASCYPSMPHLYTALDDAEETSVGQALRLALQELDINLEERK